MVAVIRVNVMVGQSETGARELPTLKLGGGKHLLGSRVLKM